MPVLATVALRRGDLAAAAEYGQRLSAIGRYYGSSYLANGVRLVAAQVLEARRGPRAALDFLAEALAGLPEHRSVLLADPASAPWLVRAALAAGDRALAARIVSAINDTARDNPTLAVIRASAEHAEGLLAGDASRLQYAADQLADPWARACAVEDQGVLLAAAGRDDEAIRCLEEALMEYGRLGARRGVARTRRRLRQLGVRRRHWASERRPTGGWADLTEIEQATALLVAEGLTNQQIADQLFISTHTVAFHLRQVFRKLDISSRVGLARIGLSQARRAAALVVRVCTRLRDEEANCMGSASAPGCKIYDSDADQSGLPRNAGLHDAAPHARRRQPGRNEPDRSRSGLSVTSCLALAEAPRPRPQVAEAGQPPAISRRRHRAASGATIARGGRVDPARRSPHPGT